VSGRKGGSQGKELFGVRCSVFGIGCFGVWVLEGLGTLGAGSEAGAVVNTRVGGQGEEELGSCLRAELLYALRVCNVSAIKSSLSSYVNSVVVFDH